MKSAKSNKVETIITATHKVNEPQVEAMVGKAMCAYANWRETENADYDDPQFRHESQYEVVAAYRAEYEATVRCIAMFVDQPTSYICKYVIDRCAEEFGIR